MTTRLYLENPYLRNIEAKLVDKNLIDDKYHIELDRTIFCPNFNGHDLKDKGTINGYEVVDIYKKDSKIIHIINEDIHKQEVSLTIDWDNRLDIIQQYTGKDLLTTSFYKLFNSKTLNYKITRDISYVDVELVYFSMEDLQRVEIYINRIISLNFPIKSHYIDEKSQNNINNRIIEIENIDFSPSSTVHLRSTGEVGILKIVNWEKIDNKIRIFFLAGNRALFDYDSKVQIINRLSDIVDTKQDIYEQLISLKYENIQLREENKKLNHIVFKPIIKELEENIQYIEEYKVIANVFEDEKPEDYSFVFNHFSSLEKTIQIYGFILEDISYFYLIKNENLSIDLNNLTTNLTMENIDNFEMKDNILFGKTETDHIEKILNIMFKEVKKNLIK